MIPAARRPPDLWASTLAELKQRGIEIHGSLSKNSVAAGATAVVLKATETATNRIVAVKVYKDPDQQVQHRNGESIPMTNFFENERRMLAGLQDCPAVPRYYYSVDSATALTGQPIQPFHVMEFIGGKRVTEYAKGSLSGSDRRRAERLIDLIQQVLRAIESIHHFGYLHRDISDGNVLVDKTGQIRLIDLAEASPLGEEHTRLISTPGFGTEGVATPAQQKVRAIQTDDVNHACTIGYALFTGRWKQPGETVADWQRNLSNSDAPPRIARILTKGMKPRDPNRKQDPAVWNTAREVDLAIQSYRDTQRSRRRAVRWTVRAAVVAVLLMMVGAFAQWQIQSHTFHWNLNRLQQQRTTLAEQPFRGDARVRKLTDRAKELEDEARTLRAAGSTAAAVARLQSAIAHVQQAVSLAADLRRVGPLQQPLQAMLENTHWNTDCPAIRDRLQSLQQDYLAISKQIETGDPDEAWERISQLQHALVQLIHDNRQSYEIGELFDHFDRATVGIDPALTQLPQHQLIESEVSKAQRIFQRGQWREARTAILAQQQALRGFLDQHEDKDQKAARIAANAEPFRSCSRSSAVR